MLDPRFKTKFLTGDEDEVRKINDEIVSKESPQPRLAVLQHRSRIGSLFYQQFSEQSVLEQLQSYCCSPVINFEHNPIEWWVDQGI